MANYTCTNNSYCHGSSQSTQDGVSCGCGCEGAPGCDCSSSEASGACDLKTLLVFIAIIILLITIL